ncbi:hypothetical protein FRC07_015088 [Ceratobasidium sp. 392]|nr:hypothetical protein FRC07_015088 [Ceratobasidium sp. 392]
MARRRYSKSTRARTSKKLGGRAHQTRELTLRSSGPSIVAPGVLNSLRDKLTRVSKAKAANSVQPAPPMLSDRKVEITLAPGHFSQASTKYSSMASSLPVYACASRAPESNNPQTPEWNTKAKDHVPRPVDAPAKGMLRALEIGIQWEHAHHDLLPWEREEAEVDGVDDRIWEIYGDARHLAGFALLLSILYDVHITRTPMIMAIESFRSATARYSGCTTSKEEGGIFIILEGSNPSRTRRVRGSLVVQLAANDPKAFADACELIHPHVDGVDLNYHVSGILVFLFVDMSGFPLEIWFDILQYLTRLSDLQHASLVCHTWYTAALPFLYHTVTLRRLSHYTHLAQSVKKYNGTPRFAQHIRQLTLERPGWGESAAIDSNLASLAGLVGAATKLERFAWKLGFVPRSVVVLERLKSSCPNLRSFEFESSQNFMNIFEESHSRMFDFENLVDFGVSVSTSTAKVREWPNFIVFTRPLLVSPALQTLNLSFGNGIRDNSETPYLTTNIFDLLEKVTFPALHSFSIGGSIYPGCYRDLVNGSSLNRFIARHSGIRTFFIGWLEEETYSDTVVLPESLEILLPSVQHLDAPGFLSRAVMSSRIVDNLESIGIWEVPVSIGEPTLESEIDQIRLLPRLRKMAIDTSRRKPISMNVLERLLACAPGLEELEIFQRFAEVDKLATALKSVPNLRKLTIEFTHYRNADERAEWDVRINKLAEQCLELEKVCLDSPRGTEVRDIRRGEAA